MDWADWKKSRVALGQEAKQVDRIGSVTSVTPIEAWSTPPLAVQDSPPAAEWAEVFLSSAPPPAPKTRWGLMVTLALIVHLPVFGVLYFLPMTEVSQEPSAQKATPIRPTAAASKITVEKLEQEPQTLEAMVQRSLSKGEILPAEKRFERMEEQFAKLEKISSVQSMHEIGDFFKKTLPSRQRRFCPVEQPPAGEFDSFSSLIFDVEQVSQPNGSVQLRYVMVDKEGRSLTVPIPEGEEPAAAKVLLRLKQSPTLRQFYERIFLPMIDRQLVQSEIQMEAMETTETPN